MSGQRAAIRYAKSLIYLAQEKSQLEKVFADMELIAATIRENRELNLLMNSPIVKGDKKQNVLNKVFGDKTSEITSTFVKLLTRKKREELLGPIANEFIAQYKTLKGFVLAEVTTAIRLDEAAKSKILDLIKQFSKGEVELKEAINPNLIGGFVIRIGDKMIDASISKKINDLKKELLGSSNYTIKLN